MLTAEDVERLFEEAAEEGDDYPDGFSIVDGGGWDQDGKYQSRVTVYSVTIGGVTQFFAVGDYRTGSYHSDWEYVDSSYVEVVPKEVTKTVYVKK